MGDFLARQCWKIIPCERRNLNLAACLTGGQSFRWKSIGREEWIGVFSEIVWKVKQTNESVSFCTLNQDITPGKREEFMLKSYLRLDVDLEKLYTEWSMADQHFASLPTKFQGIRVLSQEVHENVFAFICSSNNNITRITKMVEKLCELYGSKISCHNGEHYYGFPCIERLAQSDVEPALRAAGFGYRAKYIYQSALKLQAMGGDDWLLNLKSKKYEDAKDALMGLPGIGAKVADCICLMSLGHLNAVPVDTHVFQIASQRYLPHLRGAKSVTPKIYNEIVNHFQKVFGEYAGWAHTVLFCADLKGFNQDMSQQEKHVSRKRKRKKQDADTR